MPNSVSVGEYQFRSSFIQYYRLLPASLAAPGKKNRIEMAIFRFNFNWANEAQAHTIYGIDFDDDPTYDAAVLVLAALTFDAIVVVDGTYFIAPQNIHSYKRVTPVANQRYTINVNLFTHSFLGSYTGYKPIEMYFGTLIEYTTAAADLVGFINAQ